MPHLIKKIWINRGILFADCAKCRETLRLPEGCYAGIVTCPHCNADCLVPNKDGSTPSSEEVAARELRAFGQAMMEIEKEEEEQDEKRKSSACFVATAVYGSYDAPEVEELRRFRDDVLRQTSLGRTFIQHYYEHGPYCAKFVAKFTLLRSLVKMCLSCVVLLLSLPRRSGIVRRQETIVGVSRSAQATDLRLAKTQPQKEERDAFVNKR